MGEEYLKPTLEEIGATVHFGRVLMKPGCVSITVETVGMPVSHTLQFSCSDMAVHAIVAREFVILFIVVVVVIRKPTTFATLEIVWPARPNFSPPLIVAAVSGSEKLGLAGQTTLEMDGRNKLIFALPGEWLGQTKCIYIKL